jgi:hypothetical protein
MPIRLRLGRGGIGTLAPSNSKKRHFFRQLADIFCLTALMVDSYHH